MFDCIAHTGLRGKIITADETVQFINHGDALGISGFIGAGYPKALPTVLANHGKESHVRGEEFVVDIYTGASIAPNYDGVMAEADIICYRMPYQGDPALRKSINSDKAKYQDIHLSHSALYIEQGFLPIDAATVEVTCITEDGYLIPSSSVGNDVEWMDDTDKTIIEVDSWQSEELEGTHDVYRIQHLPNHTPVPINAPGDRIGTSYININLDKVVAVVETSTPDRNPPFKPLNETSKVIAGHFLDFLEGEIRVGRLAYDQYIMQSGAGNVLNAMMTSLLDFKSENTRACIEAIQDGMIDLIDAGRMTAAPIISFPLPPEAAERMDNEAVRYRENTTLRPQQISSHLEVVRHVGLIATNGMIEADVYGNVNSVHINDGRMISGIGGSGDFTRNAFVSSSILPSLTGDDAISIIVPLASHIDHTEHDATAITTERGFADLRGLASCDRVIKTISVAHSEYQPLPEEYYERVLKTAPGMSTPHDLRTAFDFHIDMIKKGSMEG